MRILVTGFDPFGNDKINPAIEAVKLLPDEINDSQIIKLEIPTVFNKSAKTIRQAILKHNPDIVLNIGQAGGRFGITAERVAINIDDARIKDNEGNQPLNEKIREDGENAYFSQLPIKAIVKAIRNQGPPSYVSNTAGTFVCNHVMYQVQYMIDKEFNNIKAGFIHIPFLPNQVVTKNNVPSLSLKDDVRGLIAALETIISYEDKDDLKSIEGKIC